MSTCARGQGTRGSSQEMDQYLAALGIKARIGFCRKNCARFFDPPLHGECAEFASSVCPFVSGRDDGYFERATESNAVKPELIYILKTTTKSVKPITRSGNMLIQAGEGSRVKIVPIRT